MTLQQEVKETYQISRRKAKKLSLKVWKYLMKHPEIDCKSDLPEKLYKQIENLSGECPLCEIFIVKYSKFCEQECERETCKEDCVYEECTGCPLSMAMDDTLGEDCEDFYNWNDAKKDDDLARAKSSSIIVNKIKRWKA